jgi:hypothetical protein
MSNLEPLDPNESDAVRLWAEIHALRAAVKGPDGFATWQDAAVAERVRRVKAEQALAARPAPNTTTLQLGPSQPARCLRRDTGKCGCSAYCLAWFQQGGAA